MQLLTLFLFIIKFALCSGVDLLPGGLPQNINIHLPMIKELNYIVLHIGNYFVTSNPHYTEAGQELMGPLHSMQNSIGEQYDNLNNALQGFVNNHNWINGRITLLAQQFISSDISNEQYQHEQQIYQDLKTTNENIQNIIKAAMNFIINHANVLTNQNGIMTALNSIEVQLEQSQFQPLKVNTAQNLALNNIQASENLNIFKEEVDKYFNILNNHQLIECYNYVLSNLHALTNIVIGNLNEFTNQVNNRLFLLNREGGHGGEGSGSHGRSGRGRRGRGSHRSRGQGRRRRTLFP